MGGQTSEVLTDLQARLLEKIGHHYREWQWHIRGLSSTLRTRHFSDNDASRSGDVTFVTQRETLNCNTGVKPLTGANMNGSRKTDGNAGRDCRVGSIRARGCCAHETERGKSRGSLRRREKNVAINDCVMCSVKKCRGAEIST